MATKNITIEIDVYDRLKAMKGPMESFSQVLRRALPRPVAGVAASELLRMVEEDGGILGTSALGLELIECARAEAVRGRDPWTS